MYICHTVDKYKWSEAVAEFTLFLGTCSMCVYEITYR